MWNCVNPSSRQNAKADHKLFMSIKSMIMLADAGMHKIQRMFQISTTFELESKPRRIKPGQALPPQGTASRGLRLQPSSETESQSCALFVAGPSMTPSGNSIAVLNNSQSEIVGTEGSCRPVLVQDQVGGNVKLLKIASASNHLVF